jgi:hypothetical protein
VVCSSAYSLDSAKHWCLLVRCCYHDRVQRPDDICYRQLSYVRSKRSSSGFSPTSCDGFCVPLICTSTVRCIGLRLGQQSTCIHCYRGGHSGSHFAVVFWTEAESEIDVRIRLGSKAFGSMTIDAGEILLKKIISLGRTQHYELSAPSFWRASAISPSFISLNFPVTATSPVITAPITSLANPRVPTSAFQ